jgi:Kdo2-lipid IVA lauroyltransferase/acyltransferase
MPPRPIPKRGRVWFFLHPRHWHRWLGIGVMRAISTLPLRVLAACGAVVGELLYYAHPPRRQVVTVNIRKCFPALSARAQRRLAKRHFRAFGQTLLDLGIAWWGSAARLRRIVHIKEDSHVRQAMAAGKSVILMTPHFVGLEMGGIRISLEGSGYAMFRQVDNEVLRMVMEKGRSRFGLKLVAHNDPLTNLVRDVRAGTPLFYLPDQDPRKRGTVFVPFFGIPTATFTSLGRLAKLMRAVVIPCLCRQLPRGKGYEVVFKPALSGFPTGDPLHDAARMNREIEQAVRDMPEQYFWMHRRFKTRPPGEPSFY